MTLTGSKQYIIWTDKS